MNQKSAVLKLTAIQMGLAFLLESVRWIISFLIDNAFLKDSDITTSIIERLYAAHFFYGSSLAATIISIIFVLIYALASWLIARAFCKDKLIDARPSFPFIAFTAIGALLLVNNLLFLLGNSAHLFDKLISG